jgi:hypothetical protein
LAVTLWVRQAPPAAWRSPTAAWEGQPGSVADLARLRRRLREALRTGELPTSADDGDRLLLVFEELASNGLRHGRPPIGVRVAATDHAWLVSVSDAAPDEPPTPAVGRDPALGGMGLAMVARLCCVHGWAVDGDRKVVWARVPLDEPPPPLTPRVRLATAQSRGTASRLAATADRLAETLDRLATQASRTGRPADASRYGAGATRARRDAERARGRSDRPGPPVGARHTGPPVAPLQPSRN